MNETIALLEEKNLFLEKFLQLNDRWLEKLNRDDFSDVERFREDRENILNIVRHIDSILEESFKTLDFVDEVDEVVKVRVNNIIDRKDLLVKSILSQDLDIMEIIEEAKSNIITELKKTNRIKKTYSYGK